MGNGLSEKCHEDTVFFKMILDIQIYILYYIPQFQSTMSQHPMDTKQVPLSDILAVSS